MSTQEIESLPGVVTALQIFGWTAAVAGIGVALIGALKLREARPTVIAIGCSVLLVGVLVLVVAAIVA